MSAIGRLWYKWVSDDSKPHTIDDVPEFWRDEVQQKLDEEDGEEEDLTDELLKS